MSDEVMSTLLAIRGDLGEIKGQLTAHVKSFDEHVKLDMEAYRAIATLKTDVARQRGFMTALGTVATTFGAAVGYLAEKLLFGSHH